MFQRFMRLMGRNNKGFTLVELMVVVIIIGILVTIAIPVYTGAQEKAQITAIQANSRIVNSAIALYASNNSGAFPASADAAALMTLLTGSTLGGPYLKDPVVLNSGAVPAYTSGTGKYTITYKAITY